LRGDDHHWGNIGELGSPAEHRTAVHSLGLIKGLGMLLGRFEWFAHEHFLHAHNNWHSPASKILSYTPHEGKVGVPAVLEQKATIRCNYLSLLSTARRNYAASSAGCGGHCQVVDLASCPVRYSLWRCTLKNHSHTRIGSQTCPLRPTVSATKITAFPARSSAMGSGSPIASPLAIAMFQ